MDRYQRLATYVWHRAHRATTAHHRTCWFDLYDVLIGLLHT